MQIPRTLPTDSEQEETAFTDLNLSPAEPEFEVIETLTVLTDDEVQAFIQRALQIEQGSSEEQDGYERIPCRNCGRMDCLGARVVRRGR